jgi:hypothetical protein
VDRDHTPPQAGLRVPDPLFTTTIPAGRRSSCPPPLPPGGQPDPHHPDEESGRLLRWARCPDDEHLRLLRPTDVITATIRGHARALCGRYVPAGGLTLTHAPTGALCTTCVLGIPTATPSPSGSVPEIAGWPGG